MLLNGFKFDLRVYALLVLRDGSYEFYVCPEGLVRVCTESYRKPSVKNMHKLMGHLTNSSLNCTSDKFSAAESANDAMSGSKRTLSAVLRELAANGIDTDALTDSLQLLCSETVLVMLPLLEQAASRVAADCGRNGLGNAFHIFGVDVLLDANGQPHLMEVLYI